MLLKLLVYMSFNHAFFALWHSERSELLQRLRIESLNLLIIRLFAIVPWLLCFKYGSGVIPTS